MDSAGRDAGVIDDEGNLLGVVNIVDALVVLFVLTVVAAGLAFTFAPSDSPNLATTNATVDLGSQPSYIADAIDVGDTYNPPGNSELTITDVHRAPQGNQVRVVLRTELSGPPTEEGLSYAGAPLRFNRTLDIATNRYEVRGRLSAVGGTDTFDDETTTVALRSTISTAETRDIVAGDQIRSGDETVATITEVSAYPTAGSDREAVFVEAELDTYSREGERYYGGTEIRRGQSVWLPADGYTVDGTVQRVDDGLERAETDVLIQSTVDVETADRLSEGDVTTVAGHETAEVETVTTYATRDPDRERVFVGLSLHTVDLGNGPQFGDTAVRRGNNITLSTDSYDLSGTIQRVEALEQRGTAADRTVTLRVSGVNEAVADAIEPGLTERDGKKTVARVTHVDVRPSVITATASGGSASVVEHPFLRDVTITAQLRVRETTSGVRFKGETIRQGSTVVLDLGTILVEADVGTIGT